MLLSLWREGRYRRWINADWYVLHSGEGSSFYRSSSCAVTGGNNASILLTTLTFKSTTHCVNFSEVRIFETFPWQLWIVPSITPKQVFSIKWFHRAGSMVSHLSTKLEIGTFWATNTLSLARTWNQSKIYRILCRISGGGLKLFYDMILLYHEWI